MLRTDQIEWGVIENALNLIHPDEFKTWCNLFPLDVFTVPAARKAREKFESCRSSGSIPDWTMMDEPPVLDRVDIISSTQWPSFADELSKRQAVRQAEAALTTAKAQLKPESATVSAVADVLDKALKKINGIGRSTVDSETIVKGQLERFFNAFRGKLEDVGVSYRIPWLDSAYCHMRGQVHTIGARQGAGKTVMGLQAFGQQLMAGDHVLYYCTETRPDELINRIAGQIANVSALSIIKGLSGVDPTQRGAIAVKVGEAFKSIAEKARNFSVHGYGSDDRSISGLSSAIRTHQATKGKLSMVYLDYFQHLRPPPGMKHDDKVAAAAYNAECLKDLAESHDIALVVLSQLNRDSVRDCVRNKRLPDTDSFRYGTELEDNSHLMSILWTATPKDKIALISREGGMIEYDFYGCKARLLAPPSIKLHLKPRSMIFEVK